MGTDAHVIVADGGAELGDLARQRIDRLEQRWSRFIATSEISRLNDHAGTAVSVSPETQLLVERAIDAWRFTGGGFDPTVLGAMIRAGYDRTFDDVADRAGRGCSPLGIGADDIVVDRAAGTVTLPPNTGFDPGGIGKGLAADLVAADIVDAGATGVCINLGGDMRVIGEIGGGPWTIALEHAAATEPVTLIGLADGAVATSTTLRRQWRVEGGTVHHLIDPQTELPSDTDLTLATVIAGEAWVAEVLAKAVILRGSAHPFDILATTGAEALVIDRDGAIQATPGFGRYAAGRRQC